MIRRREFITLLSGGTAAAWPLGARAQQAGRVRRVGVLTQYREGEAAAVPNLMAFERSLRDLGWIAGSNLFVDYRWAAGDSDLYRKLAAELVALQPDVLMVSNAFGLAALREATRSIPIVFASVLDPVGSGLVESLARPGGNATGFTLFEFGITAKWLGLLKEIAPRTTRVAVIWSAGTPTGGGQFGALQAAAAVAGVELRPIDVAQGAGAIERDIAAFAQQPNGGLIETATATASAYWPDGHRRGSASQAARHLSDTLVRRRRRRPHVLQPQPARAVASRRRLRGPHPQGREAGRSAGASANQV